MSYHGKQAKTLNSPDHEEEKPSQPAPQTPPQRALRLQFDRLDQSSSFSLIPIMGFRSSVMGSSGSNQSDRAASQASVSGPLVSDRPSRWAVRRNHQIGKLPDTRGRRPVPGPPLSDWSTPWSITRNRQIGQIRPPREKRRSADQLHGQAPEAQSWMGQAFEPSGRMTDPVGSRRALGERRSSEPVHGLVQAPWFGSQKSGSSPSGDWTIQERPRVLSHTRKKRGSEHPFRASTRSLVLGWVNPLS